MRTLGSVNPKFNKNWNCGNVGNVVFDVSNVSDEQLYCSKILWLHKLEICSRNNTAWWQVQPLYPGEDDGCPEYT
jgi:hypothetical protein